MIIITRMTDGTWFAAEPHQIANTIKRWVREDATIEDEGLKEILYETADELQDLWMRRGDTRSRQYALQVAISPDL